MITLVQIGSVDKGILETLRHRLEEVFGQSTCVAGGMALNESGWNRRRRQYLAAGLLAGLPYPEQFHDRVLGVIESDIFAPGLNFVFGQADINGGRAIISLRRLRPEFYGSPQNEELLRERALTEAVHELGHTYGLEHCPNPKCAMFFSNSLYDTDIKGWEFCPAFQEVVRQNIVRSPGDGWRAY
jgi:archaemetzincin